MVAPAFVLVNVKKCSINDKTILGKKCDDGTRVRSRKCSVIGKCPEKEKQLL